MGHRMKLKMNKNLWMMYYGAASVVQGVVAIATLGFVVPSLASDVSLEYARWDCKRRQEEKDRAWIRHGGQYKWADGGNED